MLPYLNSLHKPFIISFEVTSRCNQECNFCSAQLKRFSRDDLPTEDCLKIISKIADAGVFSIFLTGGEPLLRNDLHLLIEKCMKYGMNVSISTNGVEASIEKSSLIASSGLEEIQVSIHAPDDKTHEAIVGVNGALNQSLKGLQNLIDAGLRVTVASVATRMNHYCLPELAEQVADMGARYFRVLRLMPHTQDMLQRIVPYNDMLILVERMKDLEKRRGEFTISIHTSSGFENEQFQNHKVYNIVHPLCNTCTAGKTSMAILSNGDCFPCIELKNPELFCGNILDTSLNEIWDSEPMAILRSTTPDKYHDKCGECYSKWVCYSARCVAYNLGGDFLGDDKSCYRFIYSLEDCKRDSLGVHNLSAISGSDDTTLL